MKKGGGVMLPYKNGEKSEEIFEKYLANSSFKTISNGTYGIVSLCSLKTPLNTDDYYKSMEPGALYGTPVNTLLLKFCFVSDDTFEVNVPMKTGVNQPDKNIPLLSVYPNDFTDEINTQIDISLKTMEYLQPLCPSIVYAGKWLPSWSQYLNNIPYLNGMANMLIKHKSKIPNAFIGVIGMEFIQNSTTLWNIKYPNVQITENICRYALLKLALDTGYNHGDFHKGNLMIREDTKYFNSSSYKYRPIIIDFGRTKKIPIDSLNKIKKFISDKMYSNALSELCSIRNTNEFISDVAYSNVHYGWVCHNYNLTTKESVKRYASDMNYIHGNNTYLDKNNLDSIMAKFTSGQFNSISQTDNIIIDELFNEREKAIDKLVDEMNTLHSKEPNKYPLLPVSNQQKNNLFAGLIGGKKIKTK